MKKKLYSIILLSSLIFFWSGSFCYAQNNRAETHQQIDQAILEMEYELVSSILRYTASRGYTKAFLLDDKLPTSRPKTFSQEKIKKMRPSVSKTGAKEVVAILFDGFKGKVSITDRLHNYTKRDKKKLQEYKDVKKLLDEVEQATINEIGNYNFAIEKQVYKKYHFYQLPKDEQSKTRQRLAKIKNNYLKEIKSLDNIDFSYKLHLPNDIYKVENKVDKNQKTSFTKTPIEYSIKKGETEIEINLHSVGKTPLSIHSDLEDYGNAFSLKERESNFIKYIVSYDTTKKNVKARLLITVYPVLEGKPNKEIRSQAIIYFTGLPKPAPPKIDIFEYKIWRKKTEDITSYKREHSTDTNQSKGDANFIYIIENVKKGDKIIYLNEEGEEITHIVGWTNESITIPFPNHSFERGVHIYPKKTTFSEFTESKLFILVCIVVSLIVLIFAFVFLRKARSKKIDKNSREVKQVEASKLNEEEMIFNKNLEVLKINLLAVLDSKQNPKDKLKQANSYYKNYNTKIQQHKDIQALMLRIKNAKEIEKPNKAKLYEIEKTIGKELGKKRSELEEVFYLSLKDITADGKIIQSNRLNSRSDTIFVLKSYGDKAELLLHHDINTMAFEAMFRSIEKLDNLINIYGFNEYATRATQLEAGEVVREGEIWRITKHLQIQFDGDTNERKDLDNKLKLKQKELEQKEHELERQRRKQAYENSLFKVTEPTKEPNQEKSLENMTDEEIANYKEQARLKQLGVALYELNLINGQKIDKEQKKQKATQLYSSFDQSTKEEQKILDLMFLLTGTKIKIKAKQEVIKSATTSIRIDSEKLETVEKEELEQTASFSTKYLSIKDIQQEDKENSLFKTGRERAVSNTIFVIQQLSENEATFETYQDIKSNFFTSFYRSINDFDFAFEIVGLPSFSSTTVKTLKKGKLMRREEFWQVVEKAKLEFS